MTDQPFDLPAYLDRIGWGGAPPAADLATLRRLVLLHATAIPFENLSPYLGLPVPLEPGALAEKIVRGRRGGWCFEHNGLFKAALEAIGFQVTGLAARVLFNQPEDAITPRTHMVLRLEIDGESWIADVGFGGLTCTAPLRLVADIEQATPHEPFRLRRAGDDTWIVQARIEDGWRTLYRFDLQPAHAPDYVMANHFLCTHPSSHFLQRLGVARATPEGRYALRGNELAVHRLGAPTERRTLSPDEVLSALDELFHIDAPDVERLREKIA